MTDQDKIIELTDIVSDDTRGQKKVIELTDIVSDGGPGKDKVIELTDIVSEPPRDDAEPLAAMPDGNVIDMAATAPAPQDAPGAGQDDGDTDLESALIFDDELDEAFEEEQDMADDFVDDLGMEIDDAPEEDFSEPAPEEPSGAPAAEPAAEPLAAPEAEPAPPAPGADDARVPDISEERIDAAVARIIEEKFADRIDTLMADAVEKAVEKELARLRAILLGQEPGEDDSDV